MERIATQKNTLLSLIAKTGCVAWVLWVVLDYLAHHPYLTRSLAGVPYWGVLTIFTLVGAGASFFVHRKLAADPTATYSVGYRGLVLFLVVQACAALMLIAFAGVSFLPPLSLVTRVGYFWVFSSVFLAALLLLTAVAYVTGNLILSRLREDLTGIYPLVSIALGCSLLGFGLVILGSFGLLTPWVLWPPVIGLLAWQWRAGSDFLIDTVWRPKQFSMGKWWVPLLLTLLFALLGFNWIAAFKTFPIGYDGSGLYLNTSELIAHGGRLPAGGQAFNWSVIMAAGDVLFGSRIVAILLSHLMNVFCLLITYRIARYWLDPAYALLAAAIPFVSPYFAFHGIVDEKIDLGFTFIVLSGLALLVQAAQRGLLQPTNADRPPLLTLGGRWSISAGTFTVMVAGWLAGYAFGIKYTAIFYLVGLACWLFYVQGGKWNLAGIFLIALTFILATGIYKFGYLDLRRVPAAILAGVALLTAGGLFYRTWRMTGPAILSVSVKQFAIVLALFLLAYSPWAVKHLSEHGSFRISHLIEGKEAGPTLELSTEEGAGETSWLGRTFTAPLQSARTLAAAATGRNPYARFAKQEQEQPAAEPEAEKSAAGRRNSQAVREEITRYLGYEKGSWLYTSLPYDLTMNNNVPGSRYLTIGFIFLALLPLLFFVDERNIRPVRQRALLAVSGLVWLASCLVSIYHTPQFAFNAEGLQTGMTSYFNFHAGGGDSFFASFYFTAIQPLAWLADLLSPLYRLGSRVPLVVTLLLLLLICAGGYLLIRNRLAGLPPSFKAFCGFLFGYLFLWWIMGNGIIWYGMPIFVLLPIVIVYWLNRPERFMGPADARFSSLLFGGTIGLFMVLTTFQYFTSSFAGDTELHTVFRWPFVDYASNPTVKERDVLNSYSPILAEAIEIMNADESTKIYRVNTHYGFHIAANDVRVYNDPVLDKFDRITAELNDDSQFFDVLKAQGFTYIFFDLRTAGVDASPEQTLRKKFDRIIDQLTNSDKVALLLTDNFVADPTATAPIKMPNGKRAPAKMGLTGQTLYPGNIALFEIR